MCWCTCHIIIHIILCFEWLRSNAYYIHISYLYTVIVSLAFSVVLQLKPEIFQTVLKLTASANQMNWTWTLIIELFNCASAPVRFIILLAKRSCHSHIFVHKNVWMMHWINFVMQCLYSAFIVVQNRRILLWQWRGLERTVHSVGIFLWTLWSVKLIYNHRNADKSYWTLKVI